MKKVEAVNHNSMGTSLFSHSLVLIISFILVPLPFQWETILCVSLHTSSFLSSYLPQFLEHWSLSSKFPCIFTSLSQLPPPCPETYNLEFQMKTRKKLGYFEKRKHPIYTPQETAIEYALMKVYLYFIVQFSSVQFRRSVVSDSLRPHESQHARPPCPSPTPGVHPNPRPSSQWCHPAISSSVVPFSSCPQSLRKKRCRA